MKNKKIVIAGGTGFIGRNLAKHFAADNKVVILTRSVSSENNAFVDFTIASDSTGNIKLVRWNGISIGEWKSEIDGCDLVINLAGKSVNCRYNEKNKKEIFESRINATKAIGEAIHNSVVPPKLWINASSATIYRNATDTAQDEFTGEVENDFSVQVCKRWEKALFEERTPFTRKIAIRTAITLGVGGVMVPYFNLLKFGLGGRQGNGKQMYSWVHIDDVCCAIEFMFKRNDMEGVYNLSSPNPVSNQFFMATLCKATGQKVGLPAYKWMLKIGAWLIGTETELILKSRWVLPAKLIQAGFRFKYPLLEDAVKNIVEQVPKKRYRVV